MSRTNDASTSSSWNRYSGPPRRCGTTANICHGRRKISPWDTWYQLWRTCTRDGGRGWFSRWFHGKIGRSSDWKYILMNIRFASQVKYFGEINFTSLSFFLLDGSRRRVAFEAILLGPRSPVGRKLLVQAGRESSQRHLQFVDKQSSKHWPLQGGLVQRVY